MKETTAPVGDDTANSQNSTAEQSPQDQARLDALLRDFQCAMLGCAAMILLFVIGLVTPVSARLGLGLTPDAYGALCRITENWGCYVCMFFGTVVAFRSQNILPALILSACLLSPIALDSDAAIPAVIAFMVIMNSVTKQLRKEGYRLSFTGRATKTAGSVAV